MCSALQIGMSDQADYCPAARERGMKNVVCYNSVLQSPAWPRAPVIVAAHCTGAGAENEREGRTERAPGDNGYISLNNSKNENGV